MRLLSHKAFPYKYLFSTFANYFGVKLKSAPRTFSMYSGIVPLHHRPGNLHEREASVCMLGSVIWLMYRMLCECAYGITQAFRTNIWKEKKMNFINSFPHFLLLLRSRRLYTVSRRIDITLCLSVPIYSFSLSLCLDRNFFFLASPSPSPSTVSRSLTQTALRFTDT